MAEPTTLPVMPELFSCERLSARLTVKACGARFLRVRAATKGSQDYDSSCDQCPVGAHHAKHGTLSPNTQTQTPTETPMAAHSEYTDGQKREAAKRVILNSEVPEAVGKDLSVSGTTVRNWVKRFGVELASDAMDAAAGKEPKAKAPKALKPPKVTMKRAAKAAPSSPEDAPKLPAGIPLSVPAVIDLTEAGRLGAELGAAVRFIGDKRARTAVADAAWVLTQAANG